MPTPVTDGDLFRLSQQPPTKVVRWFRSKGYAISWDWRDVWQQQHARAFTVAKAANDEILRLLRDGVDAAIANGWSEERFIAEMTPRLQAAGWWGQKTAINPAGNLQLIQEGSPWRLKTIYRTNTSVAYATGRYEVLWANRANRPFWMYDAKNDDRTRETHRALDNRAWPADHPIWKRIYPPNGFNCRCLVVALTREQAEARGLKIEGDDQLPAGFPDEGWNFNPAEQTVDHLAVRIAPKPQRLLERIGLPTIGALIESIMARLRGRQTEDREP